MAIKTFTTGEVLTASDTNTYLANSGLVYVKSQTIGTAVSTVTVSDAFSATYDSYQITIEGTLSSAVGAALNFRCVTSGGADNASNWKGNSFYIATGSAGGLTNAPLVNNLTCECGGFSPNAGSMVFTVQAPFLSARTSVIFQMADSEYFRTSANCLNNATSYTAFKLSPNTGTFTGGTITVYGYRKA
jgi:hypothetical protein